MSKKILKEKLEFSARAIAMAIDEQLEEWAGTKVGFALLIFDFGEDGNLAWVSNAEREDMIKALQEFIEKEGISISPNKLN